ncbi:ABC transporter substrate-binding protein [Zafaria sp. J156]|uniref:ABC transporter substrate-binding protein n=1 Tax=Zafaria sp. J156 TaxID=3116490 RepID=UPI002E79E8F9|nr:ABC transporter substrate-binding protein [Zafaria sp. J156]MEE1620789.1 ABC transporter substrate-binding protein [Zafaria sp. J156]
MERSAGHDDARLVRPRLLGRRGFLGLGAVAAAALAGCTPGTVGTPATTPGPTGDPEPLVFRFGTAAAPETLDPALAVDNESFRITRQVFETLVGVDPNTGAPTPALATGWTVSDDGLRYRFTLRQGVLFHDGTAFDAEACVANFQRWASLPPELGARPGQAFDSVFHHHPQPPAPVVADTGGQDTLADRAEALEDAEVEGIVGEVLDGASYFAGCTAVDPMTFELRLRAPLTGLIEALTMAGFGIASPRALEELAADEVELDENGAPRSAFGAAPVGTGPFAFAQVDGDRVVLESFDGHWQDRGQVDTVEFGVLRDAGSRLRSLRRGDIDGYDMVTLDELRELVRGGQQLLQRDPFSVFFLGMNQQNAVLADVSVRQAVAHAVDRQRLIERFFISGTKEARSFLPPSLGVPSPEGYYGYNPDAARELLAEAGYDGEPVPFTYPLGITRAYLPLPERIYAELSRQLSAVGITIRPVPVPWSEGYLQQVLGGEQPGFNLLGWSGSYRDPDHFLSSIFGASARQFGYAPTALRTQITTARSMAPGDERTEAYRAIGELLAADLPALPIAYPISAVAVGQSVTSYPSSPVLDEVFDRVNVVTD